MAHILIVYGTTEGQTAKIAHFMAAVVRQAGHAPEVVHADTESAWAAGRRPWDAVIVGASLHEGQHQRAVVDWIRAHRTLLERTPSGFFQVGLTSAVRDEHHDRQASECVERLRRETGWAPGRVGLFEGALKYTQYDWLKRQLMRMIAKQDGRSTDTSHDVEYTDWGDVQRWAETFVGTLGPRPTPRAPPAPRS